jgi:hypothetical protein
MDHGCLMVEKMALIENMVMYKSNSSDSTYFLI